MATEAFANNFAPRLAVGCSAIDGTITVDTVAPAALQAGQFRILVDQEYMLVTAGQSGLTWTVTRGIEGSTAAAHQQGVYATHVLTAGALQNASLFQISVDAYTTAAATLADAIQMGINAVQANGGGSLIFGEGLTYTHTTGSTTTGSAGGVPAFAPSIPCDVNLNGAKIVLSSSVKQAFTVKKGNDYDTFTGISIHDGIIDGNAQTGSDAAVFGTVQSGTTLTRLNLDHIAIRRIKSINVAGSKGHVMLIVNHPASGETQTNITDIVIEDVDLQGGQVGIAVQGSGGTAGTGVQVFVDRVYINRWKHDTLIAPTGFLTSLNVQLVSTGFGGSDLYISNGTGLNSSDVGIEVDAAQRCVIENVQITNSYNGSFFHTNDFHAPTDAQDQQIFWKKCKAVATVALSGGPRFQIQQTSGRSQLGTHTWEDCTFERTNAGALANASQGEAFAVGNTSTGATVNALTIRNFQSNITGPTGPAGAATWVLSGIWLATAPTITPRVRIDGWTSIINATQGGGALAVTHLRHEGAQQVDTSDLVFDHQVSGQTGNSIMQQFGATSATINGTTRKGYVRRFSGNATPWGVAVMGTGTLTITNEILVADWDFRNLTGAGGTEVRFNAAQNRNKTRLLENKYVTYPRLQAAMATTNFTAAAWTTAVWNQYLGGDDATVCFAGGSGAGITAIDISADGGTTVTNLLTQAGAAMPGGGVTARVKNGYWIRVTFATTQPTTSIAFM